MTGFPASSADCSRIMGEPRLPISGTGATIMSSVGKAILHNILVRKDARGSTEACSTPQSVSAAPLDGRASCAAALTAGIEDEVVELFRQNSAALSRYAATVTKDKETAQDGIQEAFLRYFAARTDGRHVGNPRAWLFTVLRNYILDHHRRSGTFVAVELEAAGNLADLSPDQEARLERIEISQRILACLSPREQECLQLRLEGLGYLEIAQVLRIRPGTVGALLARGLKKIRGLDLTHRRD